MSDRVRVSIQDGVADVRMNRAEKMNALDHDMFRALAETGRQLAADSSVRAIVLSGEGRAFCAGLDFSNFAAMGQSGGAGSGPAKDERGADAKASGEKKPALNLLASLDDTPANTAQTPAWIWQEVPQPVIAAVHGVAYGGGLQIALGADIRIVGRDARMSVMEIKWGLVPDMSATQTLRHLVRLDVAKELTFTGRVIEGPEAVELGLATRVSDHPLDDALKLAAEIASKSPSAIRAGKQLLNDTRDMDVASGLALEARLQTSLIGKPNQIEAVRANLEKREPSFRDE